MGGQSAARAGVSQLPLDEIERTRKRTHLSPWPQRSPSEALSPSAGPRCGPPDRHQQRRLALVTNLHRSAPCTTARRGRSSAVPAKEARGDGP